MISSLKLQNIGPAAEMALTFGQRLNLLTGDNGLGKSFLLDIVWWALTGRWPAEINSKLTAGKMARPGTDKTQSFISYCLDESSQSCRSRFVRKEQAWISDNERPANSGIVIYVMSDGSFAVWDPHRNYISSLELYDFQVTTPAYVFGPKEVWDGLQDKKGGWLCNGLIRDWSIWQARHGQTYQILKEVLECLSPAYEEKITPGKPTRIGLDDVRDMPTIKMPYSQEVPVVHASAGLRRILAMSYILVWAWVEHKNAVKQLQEPAASHITFLVDEVEAHLHPSWQRKIVPALLKVVSKLIKNISLQLIISTHSPLIMTSVEPEFDCERDSWFDIDLKGQEVELVRRDFEKHGDVATWLISEAFDLKSGRSVEYERLLEEASQFLAAADQRKEVFAELHKRLMEALGPKDDFLFRWRFLCRKKGLLK